MDAVKKQKALVDLGKALILQKRAFRSSDSTIESCECNLHKLEEFMLFRNWMIAFYWVVTSFTIVVNPYHVLLHSLSRQKDHTYNGARKKVMLHLHSKTREQHFRSFSASSKLLDVLHCRRSVLHS